MYPFLGEADAATMREGLVAVDQPVAFERLPLMLTVEEAAQVLRIGRNGAYAAVADGVLPSVRIGRTIRIPRHALAGLVGLAEESSNAPVSSQSGQKVRR